MDPKKLLKWVLPHGVVRLVQSRQERGYRLGRAALAIQQNAPPLGLAPAAMIDFLVGRGLRRDQVTEGSMPAESLEFLAGFVRERCRGGDPLRGLHIGNFVGVSLTFFAGVAAAIHPGSVVVAVDPNIPHRGISHPQDHVCALLEHVGLAHHVLLTCGFSRARNVGDDGRNYLENYRLLEPAEARTRVGAEHAPDRALDHLVALGVAGFDFVLLDGNHEAAYVADELDFLRPLLKPGALVFLDDVSEGWPLLKQLFEGAAAGNFRALAADGRVGVLEAPGGQNLPA